MYYPGAYGAGVAIGYHEKVIRNRGNGVVVMVRDDDAMVPAPFPDQSLDFVIVYRIYLRKRLVQNVKRRLAQQHKV